MVYSNDIQQYCLAKKMVTEEEPFGPGTVTYKVAGKIFCFMGIDANPVTIAIKGVPEELAEIKEMYSDTFNGAYLNKKHWLSIRLGGDVPDAVLQQLLDTSYKLVVKGLPKAVRVQLEE